MYLETLDSDRSADPALVRLSVFDFGLGLAGLGLGFRFFLLISSFRVACIFAASDPSCCQSQMSQSTDDKQFSKNVLKV